MSNAALLGGGILDGLISAESQTLSPSDEPVKIPLSKIHRWKEQPRCYFSETSIDSLADSFKKHGFQGVLVVRPHPAIEKDFQLVAGERRWRAASRSDLTEVFCFIADLDDDAALDLALRENLNREDLSRLEETQGILNLIQTRFSINPEIAAEIINRAGRSNVTPVEDLGEEEANIKSVLDEFDIPFASFRTNFLPTLSLPEALKKAHLELGLSYNAAKALNRIKDSDTLEITINEVLEQGLSVAAVRELVAQKLTSVTSTTTNHNSSTESGERTGQGRKANAKKEKPGQCVLDLRDACSQLSKAKIRKKIESNSKLKSKVNRMLSNVQAMLCELEVIED